jgi:DNA-3-methyladenine glycosylase
MTAAAVPLPGSFYRRDTLVVAPDLLNKVMTASDGRSGRIVEVEAYCGALDAAAHTYRGKTPRNATMFGPPGHMYVYFTYGMHWCANAVAWDTDPGSGILIRALEPLTGVEQMRAARGSQTDRHLCSGPARLCKALGITGKENALDLTDRMSRIQIRDDGVSPPDSPGVSTRIGIARDVQRPWRWYVPGNRHVSGPRHLSRSADPRRVAER